MKRPLVLIGGGGHCVSCIDVVESNSEFIVHGIIDKTEKLDQKILRYKIIGVDADIERLVSKNYSFLITVGFISNVNPRVALFEKLVSLNAEMPFIVSSEAYFSQYAKIEMASIVMHRAIVNAGAVVGKNVIINTNAVIEHSAIVGDHSHISTGAFVNGDCVIGDRVFIGSNSVVAQGVSVSHDVIIGAGSVVINSIKESGVYVGNPARKIR